MTAALRPTGARLALLRAVADRQVWHYPGAMGYPAESRHGRKTVTATIDAMEAAGWIRRGRPADRHIHAPSCWEVAAAGRVVLDAHPEEQP